MNISIELTRPQLKVFSEICANLAVVWLITLFATKDLWLLTGDVVGIILAWKLAVKTEDISEVL